jgi:prophage DNA circulation protein
MALLDRLYSASFNGIPFLMSSSDMSYARKTVTHEYPNKKFRYVEDLGENLKSFDIRAIITGDDYLILREAFIISLQMKGVGILIHPFYGALTVVVKNYTVSEDMTRVGECIFTITFQEAYLNIFPEFLGINISGFDDMIEQISQNTADFLRDNI